MGVDGMDALLTIDDRIKLKLVEIWKTMNKRDREHFINQVALALSVWGADDKGKQIAVDVFRLMMEDESSSLSDFGLYVGKVAAATCLLDRQDKVQRAAAILDGYRTKYGLSSEPHRDIV
jgi:hypothetical protein